MNISIIVAMSKNRVIGNNGRLPWRLKADLKKFKENTIGKPIIMGRKTHESIGRALPSRNNIVLTTQQYYQAKGCTVLHGLKDAFDYCEKAKEVIIIGGSHLYQATLAIASRLYLTQVHTSMTGDTFFPEFNPKLWKEISREDFKADEQNEFDYSFIILDKK